MNNPAEMWRSLNTAMRLNRPITDDYVTDLCHSLNADPALVKAAVNTKQIHLLGHAEFDRVTLDEFLKKQLERRP